MDEEFILSVRYKGTTLQLEARMVVQGYIHRFHIMIYGNEYIFELDDNREYRVIKNTDNRDTGELTNELFTAVIDGLEALRK
jgi:hypothetical protein